MEEVNRDRIIKALELHSKLKPCMEVCPYGGDNFCGGRMAEDALKLIKELTEENERIKADTIRNIKIRVYNKAVYPDGTREHAYFSLKAFDNIIDSYRKE